LNVSLIAKSDKLQKYHLSTTNLFPSSKPAKDIPENQPKKCPLSRRSPLLDHPPPLLVLSPSSFLRPSPKCQFNRHQHQKSCRYSTWRTLATSGRLLVVIVGTLVFLADVLDRLGASLCDGGGVAVVAVDADEVFSVCGFDVVDDDFSGTTIL
jgi:hypothetical protein